MVGSSDANYFESLPDDILMLILIRIPAEAIFCAVMAVCRKWYQMIHTRDFVFAHLDHSTPGLLIQNIDTPGTPFLSIPTDRIDLFNLKYKFNPRSWSSCNGLILEADPNDAFELEIMNPITKQRFPLPPFIVRNKHPNKMSAIACVSTARTGHKVVRAYQKGTAPKHGERIYCAILTYGVDNSWRHVDTQHLSITDSIQLNRCPIVTEGFVHWAEDWRSNAGLRLSRIFTTQDINGYVLTLNMETETITRIPVPRCSSEYYYYYKYFSGLGSCLSLLIGCGNLKWEVWEMKPETLEWTRLPDMDLESFRGFINQSFPEGPRSDCKLTPAGWLKYREVIVFVGYGVDEANGDFRQSRLRVAYHVQKQSMFLFELDDYHYHPYLEHRFSLLGIC